MDLFEFLEDNDLEYWTDGKNVSAGWVNIECIFCDDMSNHLGIRLSDLRIHCWKCGGHTIVELIREITSCTWSEAKQIAQFLGAADADPPKIEKTASSVLSKVSLPRESSKYPPELHTDYLRGRGFMPRKLIRKYKLQFCYTIGKYKFRIIIPIRMNRKLVGYTSRAIYDEMDPPYLHAKKKDCIIDPSRAIYNYDNLKQNSDAFLVEGPIDAWKLGDGAVSIFGVEHTEEQLLWLSRKKIRNLYVFFDSDAPGKRTAKKVGRIMAPVCKNVEILTLKKRNDPGELKPSEVESIKNLLNFNSP
jgi:5S rRNA maturation endonuclease (ribonuclease M5)